MATLALGALAYATFQHEAQTSDLVKHTRDVIDATRSTLSSLQDAETGQRGYLITAADSYLEPYNRSVATIDGHLDDLRELTQDNPRQKARVAEIERLAHAKMAELAETVELRRTAGFDAARAIVELNRGQSAMDSLRTLTAMLEADEQFGLEASQRQDARSRDRASIALVVGTLVSALLALAVSIRLRRDAMREAEQGAARAEALTRTEASESRYRALVAATSEFVWRQGPGGRNDAASSAWWQALTGQPIDDNRPLAWLETVHPDDRAKAKEAWTQAFSARLPFDAEYRVQTRHGAYRHLAVRGVPVGGPTPETTEWVGTFNDITAEREAEASLKAAAMERERLLAAERMANRAKSDFLANMSHELRTPLNAIQGYVQLLEMELHGPITSNQRDMLTRVDRAQRHLAGLINDVLNFAKLDAGKVEYDIRPVELRETIADVASMIEPQLAARGVEYRFADGDGAGVVMADADKLRQILLNLLTNAGKFTPEGGSVTVDIADLETRPEMLFVRVTDTGIGIPADKIEAIFEPFVQVRSERSRAHDGVGLGLAISRGLAQAMGGNVRVRSKPGEGSTFTLSLRRANRELSS